RGAAPVRRPPRAPGTIHPAGLPRSGRPRPAGLILPAGPLRCQHCLPDHGRAAPEGPPPASQAGGVGLLAPDSLGWEPTELGYTEFLQWLLSGHLALFYKESRWPGWEAEVEPLT